MAKIKMKPYLKPSEDKQLVAVKVRTKKVTYEYRVFRKAGDFLIPLKRVAHMGDVIHPNESEYFDNEGSVCVLRQALFYVYRNGVILSTWLRLPAANKAINDDWKSSYDR